MKNPSSLASRLRRAIALLAIPVVTASLGAQVLMLDFGGTTVASPYLTNSPYHSVNSNFTDTAWNKQGISSDNTLVWSDGTTATGVSYNALKNGDGDKNVNVILKGGWLTSTGVTGSTVNTGIYAGSSVAADGHIFSTTLTDQRAVGIQVLGLALGTYDIYVSGRNTNFAGAYNMNFYATASGEITATATSGNGSSGTKLNLGSGFTKATNSFENATDKTSEWSFTGVAATSNYAKLTITITAENPYLNIIAIGDAGADMAQGVFNSIQIVSVIPEPSSYALLAGAGGLLVVGARRRVRNP